MAIRNYKPRTEREVGLVRGQLVGLVTRLDTHWYLGRVTGDSGAERMGLVPGEWAVVTTSDVTNVSLLSASHVDIIHSSGGGALPELPEWAVNIKRSVTMELEVDRIDELKEVEGERRF